MNKILKDYMMLKGVPYIAHLLVRRVSYGSVYTIYLEEADYHRAFALLENPATSISITIPPSILTSVSAPAISITQFDVDEKERNVELAITNRFK